VSTVGREETVIREYIRKQEQEEKQLDQMNLGDEQPPSRWLKPCGAALATPLSRFERLSGSQTKALGFAGGYLPDARTVP
jgi:hypothetical protein